LETTVQVSFTQVYIEVGANFPFSHLFQHRLSEAVTALVVPSALYLKKYGADFELIFYISAKRGLENNEIRGPRVFKKAKDVEYSVFLPFDVIMRDGDAPRHAVILLLKGVCAVLAMLEIDKTKLLDHENSIIDSICSDPTMLAAPSWNPADNITPVRTLFTAFFEKNKKR
jgi:hypothetical protein